MKTKDLRLRTDWIRTYSLGIDWYDNSQMRWRYERKNGKFHGDSKYWFNDGSLQLHYIYENGRVVKKIV